MTAYRVSIEPGWNGSICARLCNGNNKLSGTRVNLDSVAEGPVVSINVHVGEEVESGGDVVTTKGVEGVKVVRSDGMILNQ
jgi:hypothetical protein